MKKMLVRAFTFICLFTGSLAIAGNVVDLSAYYSTFHPKTKTISKALALPLTNITVMNYSDADIYVTIPGSPIDDYVPAGKSDTISNDTYSGVTHLLLQYVNRSIFYDNSFVCQRAIITVDNYFYPNLNPQYCY